MRDKDKDRVVVEVVPSMDPDLLRRFDRWLQKLVADGETKARTKEDKRG